MKHGSGDFTWPDGKVYRGNYVKDKKDGYGIFEWADGRKYIGYWKEGKQHGRGTYISPKGTRREGMWNEGRCIQWLINQNGLQYKKPKNVFGH